MGSGCGGRASASWINVEATENWPSRRRCMAIARLTKEGWDESASFSAVGNGLSLNFWEICD